MFSYDTIGHRTPSSHDIDTFAFARTSYLQHKRFRTNLHSR